MNKEKWDLVVKAVKELEHYINNDQFLVTVFNKFCVIENIEYNYGHNHDYNCSDENEILSINIGGQLHIASYEREDQVIPYLQKDINIYQLKKELLPETISNLQY